MYVPIPFFLKEEQGISTESKIEYEREGKIDEGREREKGYINNPTGVFKGEEKQPLRYSHDSFVKELIGKKIRISLLSYAYLKINQ